MSQPSNTVFLLRAQSLDNPVGYISGYHVKEDGDRPI
jgi:hypothetical protein